MFQRHLTHDYITRGISVLLGVEILNECHPLICCAPTARLHIAWVNTHTLVIAHLAKLRQKLPLATPNLRNPLVAQVIPLNQVGRQARGKRIERR